MGIGFNALWGTVPPEQMAAGDPPVDKILPSLGEMREAVRKLKRGRAAGICGDAKDRSEAMIRGLHLMLSGMW